MYVHFEDLKSRRVRLPLNSFHVVLLNATIYIETLLERY